MELSLFIFCTLAHVDIRSVAGHFWDESDLTYNESTTVLGYETGDVELETTCESITKFECQRLCTDNPIFEDDFNTMHWTRTWQHEIRTPMDMDIDGGEFVSYQKRPENCFVSDGKLHIVPGLQSEVPGFDDRSIRTGTLDLTRDCTGFLHLECYRKAENFQILPPIVSARIRTKGSFEFRYGRVEVRAKLPKADWAIPLILLEPAENFYGIGKYSGQMKAVVVGNDEVENPTETDGFHVYTLEWTDKYISLSKDGTEFSRQYGGLKYDTERLPYSKHWKNGDDMAPFDRKFYITLGVAVGGHSNFPDWENYAKEKPWKNLDPKAAVQFWNARKQWMSTYRYSDSGLIVDYVRVYSL